MPDPVKGPVGIPYRVWCLCKVGVHAFQRVTTLYRVRESVTTEYTHSAGYSPPPLQGEDLRQAVRTCHRQGTQSRQGNPPPPPWRVRTFDHVRTCGTQVLDRYCAKKGGPSGRRVLVERRPRQLPIICDGCARADESIAALSVFGWIENSINSTHRV